MLALTAVAPATPTARMETMVMSRVRPENHPVCWGVVMALTVRNGAARGRPGQGKRSVKVVAPLVDAVRG